VNKRRELGTPNGPKPLDDLAPPHRIANTDHHAQAAKRGQTPDADVNWESMKRAALGMLRIDAESETSPSQFDGI
jgi:hypothetical protein